MRKPKYTHPGFGGYASYIPALYTVAEQGQEAIDDYVDEFIERISTYKGMPLYTDEKRNLILEAFVKALNK